MTFTTIGLALLIGMQLFQIVDKIIDKLSSSECTNKGMRVEMKHKQELELAPHESLESHISRESSSKSETPKKPRSPKKKKQLLDKKSKSHESNSEIIDIDISEEEAQQDQTDYENNYTEEDTESL